MTQCLDRGVHNYEVVRSIPEPICGHFNFQFFLAKHIFHIAPVLSAAEMPCDVKGIKLY